MNTKVEPAFKASRHTKSMVAGLLLGLAPMGLAGCGAVADALKGGAEAPDAELARVDLVKAPNANKMLRWGCYTYLDNATCQFAGLESKPEKEAMKFSFDIVFNLFNPNENFPIPLVEMLLGMTVYEDENLGAVCVSFCDPDKEDCAAETAEEACSTKNTKNVDEVKDLVPSVDQLMDLAEDASDGSLEGNYEYRVIPKYSEGECQASSESCEEREIDGEINMCCGDECTVLDPGCTVGRGENGKTCALCDGFTEAHVTFDFDIDTMLDVLDNLFRNAINDFSNGREVSWRIPYAAEGNVFFNIPEMGRYALGFGPFEDTWQL